MTSSMSTMLFLISITHLSGLIEKQAPLKTLLKRKLKQFSKPWMTSGPKSKKSMKVKKPLFQSGDFTQYKLYRNKISTQTRLSEKNYCQSFFADNLNNMKHTWNGINTLSINGKKKKKFTCYFFTIALGPG